MAWADISALYRYWRDAPPVHELLAARWGVKPIRGREASREERPVLELTADQIRAGFAAGQAVPLEVP